MVDTDVGGAVVAKAVAPVESSAQASDAATYNVRRRRRASGMDYGHGSFTQSQAGGASSVRLIVDGCRAVELQPGDGARAIAEMLAAGVEVVTSGELLARDVSR